MENKEKKEVINDGCYASEEEKEEIKIEKFYSLLRSFREARDRLRRREELHDQVDQNESSKKKMKTQPCFELQDFTTDIRFPFNFPDPVKNNNGEKKKEQLKEHAIDLKLAL